MTDVTTSKIIKNKKGGRPRKAIKKDQLLGVKCSLLERKVIESKARESNTSVSEYLRKLGLTGKVDMKIKTLSKEILQFKGTLNHLAANLNQVAKKRNMNDELNALERASLEYQSKEIKQLANDIKNFLS
ncbi:MAG TPA: mobilization protein [Chitinophagaceae bacterium]